MQHDSASVQHTRPRLPSRTETATLALAGYALCVSGFFVLAAAGAAYPPATYALILGGALLAALPVLLVTLLVTGTESLLGRAWGSGFRRLEATERTRSAGARRALRYAGVVWIANGLALWFAGVTSLL